MSLFYTVYDIFNYLFSYVSNDFLELSNDIYRLKHYFYSLNLNLYFIITTRHTAIHNEFLSLTTFPHKLSHFMLQRTEMRSSHIECFYSYIVMKYATGPHGRCIYEGLEVPKK